MFGLGSKSTGEQQASELPTLLLYGVPGFDVDRTQRTSSDLVTVDYRPIGSEVSFLDYDGVIVFAGAFEKVKVEDWGEVTGAFLKELDQREQEAFGLLKDNKPVIVLVRRIPDSNRVRPEFDLFRRFLHHMQIRWQLASTAVPMVDTAVAEYSEYVRKHGAARIVFDLTAHPDAEVLLGERMPAFGFAYRNAVFLPAVEPRDLKHGIRIAADAAHAVIAQRRKRLQEHPAWLSEFVFAPEQALRDERDVLKARVSDLTGEIDQFARWKKLLVETGEPLVDLTTALLRQIFRLEVCVDERCVEDATIMESGKAVAVVEIKGVNKNFDRAQVNQLDSHRERLGLPTSVPGVLIVNTKRKAKHLEEKEEQPHPDIIKKAVAENVLLMRTLDLLRLADLVLSGSQPASCFLDAVKSEPGWLRVMEGGPGIQT